MTRIPIRMRLALIFTAIMAFSVLLTGTSLYLRLVWGLDEAYEDELRHRFDSVAAVIAAEGTEELREFPSLLGGALVGEPGEEVAQVLDLDGALLETPQGVDASLLPPNRLGPARIDMVNFEDVPRGGDHMFRLRAGPVETPGGRVIVVAARSLEDREEALAGMISQSALWGLIVLTISSALAYFFAGAALRPVEAMRRQAGIISTANLEARLPIPAANDEIARLGGTLNEMLERLKQSVELERGFLADASHELRTPLALLKTELDLALRQPRSQEELLEAVKSAAEETDRLSQLADDLLVLARADHGRLSLRVAPVNLKGLLDSTAEGFRARAERDGRSIVVLADPELQIWGDDFRLEQALRNVIENALRYGAGTVQLRTEELDGEVRIHVEDEGPGFPAAFLPRAFQRFSRASTSQSTVGSGLGLAIVDTIALAHGGHARADNRDSGGADVCLIFPRSQPGVG